MWPLLLNILLLSGYAWSQVDREIDSETDYVSLPTDQLIHSTVDLSTVEDFSSLPYSDRIPGYENPSIVYSYTILENANENKRTISKYVENDEKGESSEEKKVQANHFSRSFQRTSYKGKRDKSVTEERVLGSKEEGTLNDPDTSYLPPDEVSTIPPLSYLPPNDSSEKSPASIQQEYLPPKKSPPETTLDLSYLPPKEENSNSLEQSYLPPKEEDPPEPNLDYLPPEIPPSEPNVDLSYLPPKNPISPLKVPEPNLDYLPPRNKDDSEQNVSTNYLPPQEALVSNPVPSLDYLPPSKTTVKQEISLSYLPPISTTALPPLELDYLPPYSSKGHPSIDLSYLNPAKNAIKRPKPIAVSMQHANAPIKVNKESNFEISPMAFFVNRESFKQMPSSLKPYAIFMERENQPIKYIRGSTNTHKPVVFQSRQHNIIRTPPSSYQSLPVKKENFNRKTFSSKTKHTSTPIRTHYGAHLNCLSNDECRDDEICKDGSCILGCSVAVNLCIGHATCKTRHHIPACVCPNMSTAKTVVNLGLQQFDCVPMVMTLTASASTAVEHLQSPSFYSRNFVHCKPF